MKIDIIESNLRRLLDIDRRITQLSAPEDDGSWVNNSYAVAFDLDMYARHISRARQELRQAADRLIAALPLVGESTFRPLDCLRKQIGGIHLSPGND